MLAIHSSRGAGKSRSTSVSDNSAKRVSSGRRHSPASTRRRPGTPPRSSISPITASASDPRSSSSIPMFQRSTSAPPGRRTRAISATDSADANQWNASAEKTASTSPSSAGMASPLPRRASASPTTSSRTPSIAASGSTAITFANRRTSERVSLPVPAPRSSTTSPRSNPSSAETRSSSSSGHSGRPSSYSRAVRPNASGGASRSANSGEQEGPVLLQHLPRDHEALDLVRALVDLRDLRVAHHPLDGVFLHVAVPAEDLDGVGRDFHRHVRAVELRHRGDLRQLVVRRVLVDHLPDLVEEPASRLALRLHVGEHAGDQLVLGDRLAHRLAALRVLERIVGRALREPEALRRDPGPRAVEDPPRDLEALALLAQQVVRRDAHVVEEDLAGRRALDAHLRLDAPDLEPGRVGFDDEGGDSRVAGLGIGLREDDVQARDAGVRDEALAAVQDVRVAVEPRLAAHGGRVGARAGLGQRVGREPLPAREVRQEALLLLIGARELDAE